jgi:hypothetical protein
LFLVVGVLSGVVCAFWQRAELYRVGVTDFSQRQRCEEAWTGRRGMELSEYVKDRTEGRLLRKDGQAWLDLYKEVVVRDEPGFFLPRRRPLDEVAGQLDGVFTYVALEQEGTTVYLDVLLAQPGCLPPAPVHLRYPLRRFALAVFAAGLLGYLLTPWPKRDPDVVAYTRFRCALLPDLALGLVLLGLFFAVPWFVVPHQARTSHPVILDGGWIFLTVILWGFCLFGLLIHAVAAWYETRRIRIAGDHLVIESMRGDERVPFADIERLTCGVREPPRALVKAGLLVSLVNPRAAGPTLLAAGQRDPVLCLVARDGRRWTFGLTGICHVERMIDALKQAGIAVDPDLLS